MTTRKVSELPEANHPFVGTEAIPMVQDGETRQVALANLLGEAAIATWLAPYRVSSQAAPADNRAALNQAILDAVAQKRPPLVLLPAGRIPLDGPVILRGGIRLNGASAADLPIGTELFLADGANGSVLQNEAWPGGDRTWECAELAYLRVNGNRAGNREGGSGVAIHGVGKTTEIRHMVVRNCARFGFEFTGPQEPLTLRNCTVEDNAAGGVRLAGDGAALIQALTGRGQGPLLVIESGGTPSIVLVATSAIDHEHIVRVREGEARLSIFGGHVIAPPAGGSVVQIDKGKARVQFVGLHHAGFERLVRDGNGERGLAAVDHSSGIAVYNRAIRSADDGGSGVGLGLGAASKEGREPVILAGAGSPPPELELPNGSLYLRSDGGEGSTFYVREDGRWIAK
ncbi:MAG TPA: right-handed parallel beta-helix repeat-containing protein [Alphaproteobacteria bacterium]|nr:right-handed parallel beta-helix repeat-containing protein [Alphaproteobacteria bacterium]